MMLERDYSEQEKLEIAEVKLERMYKAAAAYYFMQECPHTKNLLDGSERNSYNERKIKDDLFRTLISFSCSKMKVEKQNK